MKLKAIKALPPVRKKAIPEDLPDLLPRPIDKEGYVSDRFRKICENPPGLFGGDITRAGRIKVKTQ
jgi:hypothetical protein